MKISIRLITLLLFIALFGCSGGSDEQASNIDSPAASQNAEAAAEPAIEELPAAAPPVEAIVETAPAPEPAAEIPKPAVAPALDPPSGEPTMHIVKGVVTSWVPLVTYANPGDTIRFTNMTGHDTESMRGMIPEGASPWKSKLGEEAFTITVDKEGAYIYKCNPHITTGMVGAIVVGGNNPSNLADLDANAGNVKVGANMVRRAIRKMKKELEGRAGG